MPGKKKQKQKPVVLDEWRSNWDIYSTWKTAALQSSVKGKTENVFHSNSADSNELIKRKKSILHWLELF